METLKVAIASTDGVNVNMHFGAATHFLIFEIKDNVAEFMEFRENPTTTIKEHTDRWNYALDLLKDCGAIFCSRIGDNPKSVFEGKGVKIVTTENTLKEALKEFLTA
ncbi:NifB/NifX family molybdenum-iron cluster-binding protein [Methanococcus maripaludis]|uniref:Dinitrogenase iron-molybdenum cofactor biosynthesis protein n=2 Tax=Methanococcus maripaludis TaxID=39152 RepID=A6VFE9_METM7|nr:NifB/NifX family molybdenum-iron cluster-binding protein [Methanococcus maripaludis]MBA2861874.1 putative Fe-Mo cluster-binding NifX family protein [Methanococcus maripaludis]